MMNITYWLNGIKQSDEIEAGTMLLDFLRSKGCYSVKCGCETTNCGLCTVWIDEKPVLSCAVLAARIDGKQVTTLEGCRRKRRSSPCTWDDVQLRTSEHHRCTATYV